MLSPNLFADVLLICLPVQKRFDDDVLPIKWSFDAFTVYPVKN